MIYSQDQNKASWGGDAKDVVAISGTSAQSAALKHGSYIACATIDICYQVGSNPTAVDLASGEAATGTHYMPANTPFWVRINTEDHKIAAIAADGSSEGYLTISDPGQAAS